MRVLLLNQFTPPEGAPTARLLGDLAGAFEREGWEVVCIGCGSGYQKGAKSGLGRLWRDLTANVKLLVAGLLAGRCDWVVCLSDPPGLPFTAAVVAAVRRARLAHWAMDVYPQVAVALGALRPGLISRAVRAAMRFSYRRAAVLTALDGDMRAVLEKTASRDDARVLPPWPPAIPAVVEAPKSEASRPSAASRVWLYSGNLGRAHEFRDLLEAQRLLENEGAGWRLVFQGGGPGREAAMRYAAELGVRDCEWTGYAPEEELLGSLLWADALIATQKTAVAGLLWPSKLALMTLLDKPLLWVGSPDGQVARDLRASCQRDAGNTPSRNGLGYGPPRHGVFAPGDAAAIAAWLRGLPPADAAPSREAVTGRVAAVRERGLQLWVEWLREAL